MTDEFDEVRRDVARGKDRKAREAAKILLRDREAHAAAQTDVFRVGDVVRGPSGGIFDLMPDCWVEGKPLGHDGWVLLYRASLAALELFARPESVEFMARVRKEEPGAWFFESYGLPEVARVMMARDERCDRYMADGDDWVGIAAPHMLAHHFNDRKLHPDSARRWLEREASKQTEPTPMAREQPYQRVKALADMQAFRASQEAEANAWYERVAQDTAEQIRRATEAMTAGRGRSKELSPTVAAKHCPCGAQLFVEGFDKCGDCRRETKLGILRQSLDRRIALAKDEADPEGYVWSRPGAESP